ncbi:MAG TPA: galactose oxidase early set domain-containing protein [Pseudonocardia sp.]|jgi:hypothetical protein|nr:galactose oxidase early set domain-containing protein [Pseudonocardia sp.]
MRPPRRGGRRFAVVLTATLAVSGVGVATAPLAVAAPSSDPSVVGEWSEPFEEGGSETPRCEYVENDSPNDERQRLQCKPTAVTTAVLPDGRYLYANGIESEENAEEGAALSLSPESRDSRTRVLDIRDGSPEWYTPENETGAGTNDVIVEGRTSDDCLSEHPAGVAGVPGRDGDGLFGNLWHDLGGPEMEPTCAPDDVQENDTDVFCGDIAQMADGRQMIIGGTDWYNEPSILERADGDPINVGVVELEGLRQARIFDWREDDGKGDWSETADMKYGRWYPANVTDIDGAQLAFGGTVKLIKSTQLSQVRYVERWDPETEEWTSYGRTSDKTLPQNPRIFHAPDGRPFYVGHGQMWGPFGQAADEILFGQQAFFNSDDGSWENAGMILPRSSPATSVLPMSAPYDEMTVLAAGGTLGPPPGSYFAVATTDLITVTRDGQVTNEQGPNLAQPRWFGNSTPLPTGEVLITHGAETDEVIVPGIELPTPTPEIYDPETNTFRQVATPERIRTYHNSASLLPNGQVIVGGNSPISTGYGIQRDVGAAPFTANNDKDSSFELYSPDYLFQGDRPNIDSVQSGLAWDEDFTIETEDASSIERVVLMRMPAIQHVYDSDPRTFYLDFEQTGDNELTATTPPQRVAVPGYYYLFINKSDGSTEVIELDEDGKKGEAVEVEEKGSGELVPSVARIVKVSAEADYAEADEPMPNTEFEGNGASPTEDNTFLNNPPNFAEEPSNPSDLPDPRDAVVPGLGADAEAPAEAPAAPELPSGSGQEEGVLPQLPLGGSQGRRGCRNSRR